MSKHTPEQPQDHVTTFIYGLVDPRTGFVRYVGKAYNPKRRRQAHMNPSSLRPKTRKNHWIKSLLNDGRKPELILLEQIKECEWEDAERRWIAYYRNIPGYPQLTNGTSGGDGAQKGFKHKPESIEKMRIARKRQVFYSEERNKKISLSKLGRRRSETTIKRMSEGMKAFYSTMSKDEIKIRNTHRSGWTKETHDKASKTNKQRKKRPNTSSQFIGVMWSKKDKFWHSYIRFDGKQIDLGCFAEEIDAARARDKRAIELAGDAFRLNFPRTEYDNDRCDVYQKPHHPVQRNNKSGFRGVSFNNRPGRVKRWNATVAIDGKNVCLGYFSDKVEAAHTYDQWVIDHHDSSVYTNFPRAYYEQTPWHPAAKEKNKSIAQSSKINNLSGFRGVTKSGKNGWKSVIHYMGTVYRLGSFKTAEEAARKYDRKMIELRGDSARTNFARSDYD
jgi:hypothetical protein